MSTPAERIGLPRLLQPPVLPLQIVQAERAIDRQREELGLERLREEIVRAAADRAHGVGAVVLSGQHDDLGVRRELEDLLQQLEPFGDGIGIGRQTRDPWSPPAARGGAAARARFRDRSRAASRTGRTPSRSASAGRDRPRRSAAAALLRSCVTSLCTSGCRVAGASKAGSSKRTCVPTSGVLSTSTRPPSSCTYWKLS